MKTEKTSCLQLCVCVRVGRRVCVCLFVDLLSSLEKITKPWDTGNVGLKIRKRQFVPHNIHCKKTKINKDFRKEPY